MNRVRVAALVALSALALLPITRADMRHSLPALATVALLMAAVGVMYGLLR